MTISFSKRLAKLEERREARERSLPSSFGASGAQRLLLICCELRRTSDG